MAGRNFQVSRIYRILNILEGAPHGLSVSDLHLRLEERGLEVHKRTIYRDVELLQSAGFPLEILDGKDDAQGTRFRLERHTRITQHLVLSSRELLALYLARRALEPLRDTPFYADLTTAFGKIEERLGTRGTQALDELSHEMHFEPGPRWGLGLDPEILETVRSACAEGQELEIVYNSVNSGTTRARRVGPHYLYFAKGSLYLIAEDLESKTNKVFSLPRVQSARMLDASYTGVPATPEDFFASSFGVFRGERAQHVSLEFSPKVAGYVSERRWHASQTVKPAADGGAHVTMDVSITPEFVGWVLSFGREVQVLGPDTLVDQVCDEALAVLGRHGKRAA